MTGVGVYCAGCGIAHASVPSAVGAPAPGTEQAAPVPGAPWARNQPVNAPGAPGTSPSPGPMPTPSPNGVNPILPLGTPGARPVLPPGMPGASTPAPQTAATTRHDDGVTIRRDGIVGALGGIGVVVGALLDWFGPANALRVPAMWLLDVQSRTREPKVGHVLIVVGVLGLATSLLRNARRWRVVLGLVATAIAIVYCLQIARLLSHSVVRGMSFTKIVGIGPVVTGFAGLVLAGSVLFGGAPTAPPAPATWAGTQNVVFRPQRRKGRWLIGGLVVALLGGGAFMLTRNGSGRDNGVLAGADTDPCKVVRAGDATKLFRHDARRSTPPIPSRTCLWTAASKPGATASTPGVMHYRLSVGVYTSEFLESHRAGGDKVWQLIPASASDLDGVGDEAKIATLGSSTLAIEFVKDGDALTLTYTVDAFDASTHPKAGAYRKELVALARSVAERA